MEKTLDNLISEDIPILILKCLLQFYNEDKIGGMIRNLDFW
jgi:hypothetical protein